MIGTEQTKKWVENILWWLDDISKMNNYIRIPLCIWMFYIFFSSYNIGCGGRLSGPSGSFTSPLYPSPYHHNAECTWEIHVNRGSQIRLIFLDLGKGNMP